MSDLSSPVDGKGTDGTLASAVPAKVLAALTLGVLLAHALVLQSASLSLRASANKVTRPFITRVIEIKPASPPGVDTATANAAPAPAKAQVVRPRKPATRPSADSPPGAAKNTASTLEKESKQPVALVPYEESAINNEVIEPDASVTAVGAAPLPAMPASAASGAQQAGPAAAQAPAPAATPSSAAALPPTPNASTTAYTVPGSVRLKYNVAGTKGNLNYTARAELLWLQDGNSYEARQEVGAFLLGSRVFTSTGRMTADGLAPLRYSDKARNELAAHFDRDRQRVTFSANTPEAALQSGAQDRVSVFVQLASMLAGAPDKYPAGTAINVQIIGPRATEVWAIAVDGEEKLNLPGGELSAVKLTRAARGEFDLKTEFWLAPVLGYLPARIRFTQANGDFVDMAWRATEAP